MPKLRRVRKMTLTRSFALSADELFLACAADTDEVGYPFNRLSHFNAHEWSHRDYNFVISTIADYAEGGARKSMLVGEDGEFVKYDNPEEITSIFEYTKSYEEKLGAARINGLSQIGSHIYACGDDGRNYKLWDNGTWAILNDDLLEYEDPEGSEYDRLTDMWMDDSSLLDDPVFVQKKSEAFYNDGTNSYMCITGIKEDSIYLCGGRGNVRSALVHVTPNSIKKIPLDFNKPLKYTPSLNHIIFEDGEDRMRVCGQKGAMLVGNAKTGFKQDPAATDDVVYYNMARFEGKTYITTHLGLLVHDGESIHRVTTGLEPDAIDTHTVQAVDGMLWVVGVKDILRFDGKTWERIQYPGNTAL